MNGLIISDEERKILKGRNHKRKSDLLMYHLENDSNHLWLRVAFNYYYFNVRSRRDVKN